MQTDKNRGPSNPVGLNSTRLNEPFIEKLYKLCKENDMGFSYHVYNGWEFGMYSAYNVNKTTEDNEEWLRSRIKKSIIKSIKGIV